MQILLGKENFRHGVMLRGWWRHTCHTGVHDTSDLNLPAPGPSAQAAAGMGWGLPVLGMGTSVQPTKQGGPGDQKPGSEPWQGTHLCGSFPGLRAALDLRWVASQSTPIPVLAPAGQPDYHRGRKSYVGWWQTRPKRSHGHLPFSEPRSTVLLSSSHRGLHSARGWVRFVQNGVGPPSSFTIFYLVSVASALPTAPRIPLQFAQTQLQAPRMLFAPYG